MRPVVRCEPPEAREYEMPETLAQEGCCTTEEAEARPWSMRLRCARSLLSAMRARGTRRVATRHTVTGAGSGGWRYGGCGQPCALGAVAVAEVTVSLVMALFTTDTLASSWVSEVATLYPVRLDPNVIGASQPSASLARSSG